MKAQTRVSCGNLSGALTEDGGVAKFLGIPYAIPPVGALRWKPPQSAAPWSGDRQAKEFAPASLQEPTRQASYMYNDERAFSEDCLYLNVYTGSLDRSERRPVIVWLHMGAFNVGWSGGSHYDGSGLARAGAVVVTVNYRLGRLGFLAHPALTAESERHASGNYGILDQIAALEWVRDNIAAFGGNEDCVTIYGVSAGSCSVSVLMASPLAAGLFHRAIGSSGGGFGPTSETGTKFASCFQSLKAAERSGERYMSALGASTAAEMRALPSESLIDNVFLKAHTPEFLETVYPIVDGHVLSANPYDAFVERLHNDVPLMTGSNSEEHLVGYTDALLYESHNRDLFGPELESFREIFPMGTEQETSVSTGNANGDRVFTWQNWTWARLQARFGRQPAYYYQFAYEPPIPSRRYLEQDSWPSLGAAHSLEIPYVWQNLQCRDWPFSAVDHQLSETMSAYWLNFARSGDPNGSGLAEWPRLSPTDAKLMVFDAHPNVQPAPVPGLRARMSFWDRVFKRQVNLEDA